MPKLFGVTLFVSATLLFLVQPMVGKMILPLLGGTPAVWNTCMVFFQALLLAGYYYAHKSSTRLPTRTQVALHTGLLIAAVGVLFVAAILAERNSPVPVVKSLAPQGSSVPFFGVIALLAVAIGLPFFTVSTTAPLLQKWFSETGHPSAKDPYFLYAASNFGSLLALVSYPFVVEPNLRLVEQAWLWAVGFVVMACLILACGNAVKNAPPPPPAPAANPRRPVAPITPEPAPNWVTKIRWLFLAAVPSALMLALTTKVTTDIVSMPLIWIFPLSLYLITFIIVFSKSIPARFHLYVTLMTPVAVLLLVFLHISENVPDTRLVVPFKLQLGLELVTFFLVALTCHGELARTRPATTYLTDFYLIMSFGGMLGGLFNALVAPLVFTFITEYPISLVGACFLLPPLSRLLNPTVPHERWRPSLWDLILPLLFFSAGRFLSAYYKDLVDLCEWLIFQTGVELSEKTAATILAFGVPTLSCYFLVERPLRFGACVAALWFGTYVTFMVAERKEPADQRAIYQRSYFGTLKLNTYSFEVQGEKVTTFNQLIHGTTVHGSQHRDKVEFQNSITQGLWLGGATGPADALALAYIGQPHYEFPGREPLTYYHRSGPVGVMFDVVRSREASGKPPDVACIGLGTGSLSSYGRPGQTMTFFEIDWKVRDLVEKPDHFTYIHRARQQGTNVEFLMGDARLTLEQVDRKWGFMLVDAFSSDAIPAHLLTKEAVQLYFDRLTDDGLLALHISNRYLKLEPVVDKIVRELQCDALVMRDSTYDSYGLPHSRLQPEVSGKLSATWIIVGRNPEALAGFRDDPRWKSLEADEKVGLWTDDYTPIKSVLQGDANLFGGK